MFNILIDPVASAKTRHLMAASILSYTLGSDPVNSIGESLYYVNPGLLASIDEFRIYTNALTAAQNRGRSCAGPESVYRHEHQCVALRVLVRRQFDHQMADNDSALVNLVSSPALGAGAVWTPATGP